MPSTISGTSSGSNIASTTLQPSFVIPTHLFESVPAPTLYWSFFPAIQTQISSNPTQDHPQSSRGARHGSRRGRDGGNPGGSGVRAGGDTLHSSQPINTGNKSFAGVLGPHPSTLPLIVGHCIQNGSLTPGVFNCIKCFGVHRSLGVHITKVLSVNLDEWTDEQVDSLSETGGNVVVNNKFKACVPGHIKKPKPDSLSNERSDFIRKRKVRELEEESRPDTKEKWRNKGKQTLKRAKQRRHL